MTKHDDKLVHVQQVCIRTHSAQLKHVIPLTKARMEYHLLNLCICRHNAQLQVPPRTFSVKLQRVCLLMADVQGFTEIASKMTARYAIRLIRMLHLTFLGLF
jgi:hypothetical protein